MIEAVTKGMPRTRQPRWKWVPAAGVLVFAGCAAATSPSHTRLVAVHNAFEALGFGQMGHVSEGSLPEGGVARFQMDLEAQCYTFVAFGGEGARDVDVSVFDANGQQVATDGTHDAQATVQFCPTARGRYTVAVRMASGAGSYLFSSWRGGVRTAAGSGAMTTQGTGEAGTCQNPIPIQLGQTVTGDTSNARHQHGASCAEGEAGERVYVLQLERRMHVTVVAEQDYDGTLYIRSDCDDQESEIACNDDDGGTSRSRISQVLDPGTYYIFADGYRDEAGSFTLTVTGTEVPSPQEVCQNASPLPIGQAVTGQGTGEPDIFHASCANGARGPDRVYRLDVQQESRLQLYQETDYDGVLYVRRACADQGSEVACNDDAEDTQHSRINTILPAGTYYVFTDGFSSQAAGNYTLQADLVPVAGVGTSGDSCQDAQLLTPGQTVEGNTFAARDDVTTPCGVSQDGYDVVYRMDVQNRSRVRLWFEYSDMGQSSVLYLTRQCGSGSSNASVACRTAAVGEDNALEAVVDRGTYYVVVDSATQRSFGRFQLTSRVEDLTALERACRTAPVLRNGQRVTGTTSGDNRFQSSCAGGSRSAENLYRLVLRRRSFVRLSLRTTSSNYDASIYIRANCLDPSSERACNDDAGDVQHSLIETTLDPGTYTVFVDGFSNNNTGSYELEVTIHPQ